MFSRRTDLPLERDQISRFLPWLVAFLVYLAMLSLAGMLALGGVAERWSVGVAGTLTIEIPADARGGAGPDDIARVVDVVRATKGVLRAEAMPRGRVLALVEPWFGAGLGIDDLPLPHLIDVTLEPGARVDAAALQGRLRTLMAGITVNDHSIWLGQLVTMIRTIEALATGLVILIGAATAGTVIFTTRTGLTIHRDVIEVLHFTGARDSYVARQFAGRALSLALKGGLIGFALGTATLWGVGWMAGRMETGLFPGFAILPEHWIALAAVPLGVALLAMIAARITVMRALGRML